MDIAALDDEVSQLGKATWGRDPDQVSAGACLIWNKAPGAKLQWTGRRDDPGL